MKPQMLPYLLIDDDFALNFTLLTLIINKMSLSSRKNSVLDFERLQIYLYLTKNPSKINKILSLAGKKIVPINTQYTYTIESLSTNVDMLFEREKLKILLKELAARGMLACEFDNTSGVLKYLLNDNGKLFAKKVCAPFNVIEDNEKYVQNLLEQNYFTDSLEVINSLSALQSQTNSKLNSYLNTVFKGN